MLTTCRYHRIMLHDFEWNEMRYLHCMVGCVGGIIRVQDLILRLVALIRKVCARFRIPYRGEKQQWAFSLYRWSLFDTEQLSPNSLSFPPSFYLDPPAPLPSTFDPTKPRVILSHEPPRTEAWGCLVCKGERASCFFARSVSSHRARIT